MRIIVGAILTLLLTLSLWVFVYKTFPIFVATEALAKSRELGVLTPELEKVIRAEDYKSSLVVYVVWGMVIGIIGAVSSPSTSKLYLKVIAGLVLGVVVGALTNHLSDVYALRSDPPLDPLQYWMTRIVVVHTLLFLVAAVTANLFMPTKNLVAKLVKVVLAGVFAACIFSFLMGLVTPIEQAQFNFPRFPGNTLTLLLSSNVLVFLALMAFERKTSQNTGTSSEVAG